MKFSMRTRAMDLRLTSKAAAMPPLSSSSCWLAGRRATVLWDLDNISPRTLRLDLVPAIQELEGLLCAWGAELPCTKLYANPNTATRLGEQRSTAAGCSLRARSAAPLPSPPRYGIDTYNSSLSVHAMHTCAGAPLVARLAALGTQVHSVRLLGQAADMQLEADAHQLVRREGWRTALAVVSNDSGALSVHALSCCIMRVCVCMPRLHPGWAYLPKQPASLSR